MLTASCGKRLPDYDHVSDAGVVVEGGTFVEADTSEASKLDPVLYGDATSDHVCDLIFNALVRADRRRVKYEGDLATSWEYRDGGRTLVFRLRSGVKWHDGQPFTSKDVSFTWRLLMAPKTASSRKSDFDLVDSVDTPDDLTVIVRYKKPFAPALGAWMLGIVPEHLLKDEKDINTSSFNRHPVGTGPYKFVRWEDKQYIELAANPNYWEGKPNIARWVQRFVPDQSTQLLELRSGGVDMALLTPEQYAHQTDDDGFKKAAIKNRFPGTRTYSYMGFNLQRALFKDKRVRWAISHAVDRQALIDGVLLGFGKPVSGPYVPVMECYDPGVQPVPYDLAKAAKLLDEAGWKPGPKGLREKGGQPFKFRIVVSQGSDVGQKVVLILQQQLAKVGIRAEIESYEWSTFLSNYVNKRNFDAVVMGWQFDLDPDQYAIWHSSQTGEEQFNFISYNNPEVDRLMEEGRTTMDWQKRVAIYRRFHRIIAADQPYCFLFAGDSLQARSRKLQGVKPWDVGLYRFWYRDWYVPKSLQR